MKYVVLLVVLIVAVGIWRSRRKTDDESPAATPKQALPQPMLPCAHCGTHVPQADALMAGDRAYCSAAHRSQGPA